jgi:hypothetical protein
MDASRFHEYINDGETWIAPPFRTRICDRDPFPASDPPDHFHCGHRDGPCRSLAGSVRRYSGIRKEWITSSPGIYDRRVSGPNRLIHILDVGHWLQMRKITQVRNKSRL